MENQHIAKRHGNRRARGISYQTAFFDDGFMRQFKQRPAHIKRRKPAFWGKIYGENAIRNSGEAGKRRAGFSFPLPSFMTLAVVAGTVVISLLALNWDGLSSQNAPKTYTFQVEADDGARRQLASYAGIPALGGLAALADNPSITENPPPTENSPIAENPSNTENPSIAENSSNIETGKIPLDLMEQFKWSSYRVQRGDSVSEIASRFGVSMDAVISSNEIKNARRLREGETLRIPNLDGIAYTVKRGDSLSKISKTYSVPMDVVLDVNDIRSDSIKEGETLFIPGAKMAPDALRLAMGEMFIYPVRKKISSAYGWRISPITGERHFHAAMDLSANTGVPVKAAMDATVAAVSVDRVFGNYVILSHAGNYQSLYAHLSKVSVKEGAKVTQGGKIGEVGSTGLSTGPHLHFAVFKNGKAVNPLDLLH